jgi:alkaline phosphatase D
MRPISRRLFLAGGVAVVLASCASTDESSDPTEPPPTDPPDTTPDTTPGTTSSTAPDTTTSTAPEGPTVVEAPDVDLPGDPFTLGVASGDPSAAAVILWTRLAPDPLVGGGMPDDSVEIAYDVARDAEFTDVVISEVTTAPAEYGHSVHVAAEIGAGWHYYRFRIGEYTSPVGRTRRAPATGEAAEPVRFVSASCQNYEDGYFTAHTDIAAQEPDFVAFLGDYIYEGAAGVIGIEDAVRTHGTPETTDIVGYRNRYALYKSDPELQAAHAACPWYVTWDDHEVENNYAGTIPQDAIDAPTFEERRRQAYQVWWEHQPVALDPPSATGEFRIYRSFQWGSLLGLALVDGRQYRSDQACGDVILSTDPPCAETFDEARTMLGAEQEQWLIDTLATDTSTWSMIAQQTVFGDVTLGDAVLNFDQWDGYPASRNRIVETLDPARNTVVLTGDIHFAGVGLMRQGGRGTGTPVAVEFVATSISSGGLVDDSSTDIVNSIPDIVDVELVHRGYILHTVDETSWTADYRIVDTVKEPGATVGTYATFRVEAGTNTVAKV